MAPLLPRAQGTVVRAAAFAPTWAMPAVVLAVVSMVVSVVVPGAVTAMFPPNQRRTPTSLGASTPPAPHTMGL